MERVWATGEMEHPFHLRDKRSREKADGEEAAASSRRNTGALTVRSVPQVSGGAFAPLQEEDEGDDEGEAPGFQSQASLCEEKNKKSKKCMQRKKKKRRLCRLPPSRKVKEHKSQKDKKGLYANAQNRNF